MADPLAYGFMPMQQAQTMNWEQSSRPPSSADVLMSVLDAQRNQSRQRFHNSPFGPSFERRFAGVEMLPGEQSVPVQVGPSAEEVAQLQAALMQAAQAGGQWMPEVTTRQTGVTYSGPAIEASQGPLRSQDWYDEYVAAAQADPGASMPMIRGGGGTPVDQMQASAHRFMRNQEMEGRQANVENNAMLKSVARRGRMYGIQPMQDPRYVEALMGALGASNDGGMAGNAFLYGADNAADMRTVNMQAGMANEAQRMQDRQFQEKMAFEREQLEAEQAAAGTPYQRFAAGAVGQAMAGGNADLPSLLPQLAAAGQGLGLQGVPQQPAGPIPLSPTQLDQALSTSGGDVSRFFQVVRSMGGSEEQAKAFYVQRTGRQPSPRPNAMNQLLTKTGALQDVSLLGPMFLPWHIPGLPQLSDMLGKLQPEPVGLHPRLRSRLPELQQQP